jgi:type II secretory pathway component PulK
LRPLTAAAEPRARREDGVVFLLVLVILVLTIGSVYAFARTTIVDVFSIRQRSERVRAERLARAGVDLATRAIVDDSIVQEDPYVAAQETNGDAWRWLARHPIEVGSDARIELEIRDSGSRVNLNGLVDTSGKPQPESLEFLRQALERIVENMPGRKEEKRYDPEEIAEAILDWLDLDQTTRLGDEEAVAYSRSGPPASPLDRPLLALGELEAVPGIDPALLESLAFYFDCQPLFPRADAIGVNPNTAPPHVLALLYHGTAQDRRLAAEEDVFRVLRARREGKIFCESADEDRCVEIVTEIGRVGETFFPPLVYRSDVFEIQSTGTVGSARARVSAVIDRSDPVEPRILAWRLE